VGNLKERTSGTQAGLESGEKRPQINVFEDLKNIFIINL